MVLLELNLNIHKCKYYRCTLRALTLETYSCCPVGQVLWCTEVRLWRRNYIALHAAVDPKDSSVEYVFYCRQRLAYGFI